MAPAKFTGQKKRLLELLRSRGKAGVFVYEIVAPRPNGLGISQYNARILELRELGYDIKNVKPGHFVLVSEPQELPTYKVADGGQLAFL